MKVVGIMSGTSLDGIDVAIVDISENSFYLIGFITVPYLNITKEKVFKLMESAGIKLTPEEKRVAHHFADVIDPSKPYTFYRNESNKEKEKKL